MRENTNWTNSLFVSFLFHVIAFLCLSGLVTAQIKPVQEEILEVAIVEDLDSLAGLKGAAQGTSPGPPEITPQQADLPAPQIPQIPQIPQNKPPQPKPIEKIPPQTLPEPPVLSDNTVPAASTATNPPPAALPAGGSAAGSAAGGGLSGNSDTGSGSGSGKSGSGSGSGKGGGISPPAVLSRVKPPYPPEARKKGVEGVVELRVLILENGRAGESYVVSSSGNSLLDNAALTAINKWRFVPAKDLATGKSLARYTRVSISFELK